MIVLDHIVLNTVDVAKSADFYKKLLNVELENWEEFIDNKVKFPSLRISPTFIIDLFPPAMWSDADESHFKNNLNHFCLTVDAKQWLQIINYVKQNGIGILRGPDVYFGAQGDGMSFYVNDPDGNTIEIRKYS
jgi:catechol 2,3-dioxygenase-like lactoylglutathione lyase family enzyme